MRYLLLFCLIFPPTGAYATVKTLPAVGATYEIAEKDGLTEIEDRAKAVDWSKALPQISQVKTFQPSNLDAVPRAKIARIFLVDMTYTLERDIPDGKGGVLYPKGYKLNPFDAMPFDMTLVLIDGDDRDQIEWLAASPLLNDPKIRILATGGSSRELTEKFKRPVSYADNRLTKRFRVEAVPAIIQAQGKFIQVEEVKVATH